MISGRVGETGAGGEVGGEGSENDSESFCPQSSPVVTQSSTMIRGRVGKMGGGGR